MSAILAEHSTPSLAYAVKSSLYEFFHVLGRARQTDLFNDTGLTRWRARIAHPWFSGVLSARPVSHGDAEVVEETVAYFRAHRVPGFTWWLTPEVEPAEWGALLAAHGFHRDINTPGMAADLEQLNEALTGPPNLKIIPVDDAAAMAIWVRTFVAGYGLPGAWEQDVLELTADLGLEWPIRNYIGYLSGEPAAVSTAILGAGVAGIFNVATLPEARGQGIGAAVTLAPLRDARDRGYRVGVLQSSDMGFHVYQRLGFREVCRMEHFYRATGED